MNDSNYEHAFGKLAKYSENLLTVGGFKSSHQKTEVMKINENKNFSWSVVEEDFEEYVLLIGGYDGQSLADVFKFNGTWFPFGKL